MEVNPADKYEMVAGLEVHVQLLTKSKLFSRDGASFGAEPNTQVSPVTLAHPGTLPVLNGKAIEFAVRMGLACHCEIARFNYFARKNYFYPDLPKGYQITQDTQPICHGGFVRIDTPSGDKQVRITRIHLEEDAGKSLHEQDPQDTCIDFNRAGVPLIEIVSEPDIRSGDEAASFLTELRKLVRYLDICDGNMEEGSMRCDANVSIRLIGVSGLGTRVEIKNMNSIRNVRKAIETEFIRQVQELEAGRPVKQETRSFDPQKSSSFTLRAKEMANDYRYFPEPDLAPVLLTEHWLDGIRQSLPELPQQLITRFTAELGISAYDARVIAGEKETANYFMELIRFTDNYKAAANLILGPVRAWLNTHGYLQEFPVKPEVLAELISLSDAGKIHISLAISRVLPELVRTPKKSPLEIIASLNLLQENDEEQLRKIIDQVLGAMPEKVKEYRNGRKALLGLFAGEVKKLSGGRADPILTLQLLNLQLSKVEKGTNPE